MKNRRLILIRLGFLRVFFFGGRHISEKNISNINGILYNCEKIYLTHAESAKTMI